jgi:hypothetical protein
LLWRERTYEADGSEGVSADFAIDRRIFLKNSGLWMGALGVGFACSAEAASVLPMKAGSGLPSPALSSLRSPVLWRGDAATAYRDPAAIYWNGLFHLFFTIVTEGSDGVAYLRVASSKSRDLQNWTPIRFLTAKDKALNYSSPGNVVRYGDAWVLCLQTYPRPRGEKYADGSARIFTMRSEDLEHWDEPRLLRVKGPKVPQEAMGRMIDPFLLQDKDLPGKWWCFFKQNGISLSFSSDLENWSFFGTTPAGENPCVIVDRDEYVLFHSPGNGIGMKRSADLAHWRDEGVTTLGQKDWPWAQGRITAGFVLDLRKTPGIGKALMFFHGSRYAESDARGGFDNFASIGLAWSDDLRHWEWPEERSD